MNKSIIYLLPIIFLFPMYTPAQTTANSMVQLINPTSTHTPKGYSQVAVIELPNCRMLIFSGQVPMDKEGNLVGKDDIGKQTEQVFLNIKNAITELGGTMDNVVKLTYFIRDVSQITAVRTTKDRYINTQHPPASTLAEVSKLYREDVLIEVEATAILPHKK